MKKMRLFLYVICTALLLTSSTGCGSKDYSGGGNNYSHNDPWAYDRYYRSRVHHHHYQPDRPSRPPRPPARPARPAQLPARGR